MWFRLDEKNLVNLSAFSKVAIVPVSKTHSFLKALPHHDDRDGLSLTDVLPHAETHALFAKISAAMGAQTPKDNVCSPKEPIAPLQEQPTQQDSPPTITAPSGWHLDIANGFRTIEEFLTFTAQQSTETGALLPAY